MWPFKPSRTKIRKKYLEACSDLGDALSYAYLGEPVGIAKLIKSWAGWQCRHASLGFYTMNASEMIEYGGYGRNNEALIDKMADDAEATAFANIASVEDCLGWCRDHPMRAWVAEQFNAE